MAVLCVLVCAVLAAAAAQPAPALKIMPFGDSITEWQCNSESQGGWRNYFGQKVRACPFRSVSLMDGLRVHACRSMLL